MRALVHHGPDLVTGVFSDVTDAVITTDLHFHIRSWNAPAERLYGWTEGEVLGRHVLDVLRSVGENDPICEMRERLEHTGRWHGQSTHLTRDGSVVEILSSAALIRDPVGEALCIVSVSRIAGDAGHPRQLEQDDTLVGTEAERAAMDDEAVESDVVSSLLRGLLRAQTASAAADLLHHTIRSMGGSLVPAAEAGVHALGVDVSLGEGPPVLVEVERSSVARMQLERLLPRLVEDARQAVDLLRQRERLVEETVRDELTGLANRRILDRVLPRATSGSIVMIDLDHFKQVNDRYGHAAGDAVLVAFGKVLSDGVRAQDTSCRIGGEEFTLVLADTDLSGAVELVDRIRTEWSTAAPQTVTFSAGIADVHADGGMAALLAADRALYEAKARGRDRTELEAPRLDAGGS